MKKIATAVVIGLAVGFLMGDALYAAGAHGNHDHSAHATKSVAGQKTCPIMGGAINKSLYTDVKGKRIYVCCAGCTGIIEKDPDKYIKALEAKGEVLEKAPATK